MPCAKQTFANVSAANWTCLKEKSSSQGFPITADAGTHNLKGYDISWNYDVNSGTLDIVCQNGGVFCGMINGKIHDLIDATGCL